MLSEEEKKAIEIVKKIKNIKFNVTSSFYSSGTISLSIEEKEAIETALNLITKLQKENEEKEKQIDLMAEYISKIDIEEDVCMKNKTNPEWCNEDYTNCKNCIKQNFKKLAKEKGE